MSNKVEITGYDEHASHLKRRECHLLDGGLKVNDAQLADIGIDIDAIADCCDTTNNHVISGITGFTDVADGATGKRLKCDTNGLLEVVSSAGPLQARVDIAVDASTFIQCDAQGHLSTDVKALPQLSARQDIAVQAGTFLHCSATGGLETDVITGPALSGRVDIAVDTPTFLKCSAAGSLQVKQDDHASVVAQGVSDQANPFGTKKPFLIDTDGKLQTAAVVNVISGFALDTTLTNGTQVVKQKVVRTTLTINTDSAGGDLNSEIGQNEYTASMNATDYKDVRIIISSAETTKGLELYGCNTDAVDGSYIKIKDINALGSGGYDTTELNWMFNFLKVKGNSTGFVGISATGFTAHLVN